MRSRAASKAARLMAFAEGIDEVVVVAIPVSFLVPNALPGIATQVGNARNPMTTLLDASIRATAGGVKRNGVADRGARTAVNARACFVEVAHKDSNANAWPRTPADQERVKAVGFRIVIGACANVEAFRHVGARDQRVARSPGAAAPNDGSDGTARRIAELLNDIVSEHVRVKHENRPGSLSIVVVMPHGVPQRVFAEAVKMRPSSSQRARLGDANCVQVVSGRPSEKSVARSVDAVPTIEGGHVQGVGRVSAGCGQR